MAKIKPKQLDLSQDIAMAGGRIMLNAGSQTTPSLTFSPSTGSGLSLLDANSIGVSTSGGLRAQINDDSLESHVQFQGPTSPLQPTYSFINDTNSGFGCQGNDVVFIQTSGVNRFIIGSSGSLAFRQSYFNTPGDSQCGQYILQNMSTTDGETELFLDGIGQRLILPDNSTWFFTIHIVARRHDINGENACYQAMGSIVRNQGPNSVAIVGFVNYITIAETSIVWSVSVVPDTTYGCLSIKVFGENGKSIRWVAVVRTTEVTG